MKCAFSLDVVLIPKRTRKHPVITPMAQDGLASVSRANCEMLGQIDQAKGEVYGGVVAQCP
jgi:hypothetical protein